MTLLQVRPAPGVGGTPTRAGADGAPATAGWRRWADREALTGRSGFELTPENYGREHEFTWGPCADCGARTWRDARRLGTECGCQPRWGQAGA